MSFEAQTRDAARLPLPSTRRSAFNDGWPAWWRLRHPSCQTFARGFSHRKFRPVSNSSSPSAKLDFPEPLRPTIKINPGPGGSESVTPFPTPRNPSTVMEETYTPGGSGTSVEVSLAPDNDDGTATFVASSR